MTTARPFSEGARVAMIGDSITHGGTHPSYIQQYYLTHLRERRVKVYNLGSGGDTAAGALLRFDEILAVEPTEAVVMFGVNDISFRLFGENATEADIRQREENCRRHVEATCELVRRLADRGITVTLASSIGRDEITSPADTAADAGLRSCGATARLLSLFEENKSLLAGTIAGVVDYLAPMQTLQRELCLVGGPTLFTVDRTHASPLGQQMMARILLAAQGLPVTLPSAELLAAGWEEMPMTPTIRERRGAEDRFRSLRWVYPHQAAETEGLELDGRIAYWEKALREKRGLAVHEWAAVMYRYYVENAHREDEIVAEYLALTDALYG